MSPRVNNRKWTTATRQSPCPICEKTDWCRISNDGARVGCRRESRGAVKTKPDKHGTPIYIHKLDSETSTEQPAIRLARISPTKSGERAAPATLDHAYGFVLTKLNLSGQHRDSLRKRGLTDDEIDRRGYRSFPLQGRRQLALDLRDHLGDAVFRSLPGFIIKDGKPSLAGSPGILIPCRNAAGQIVALKVRRDGANDNKYVYLSSAKVGGPGPGAPAHVPLGVKGPVACVRLTEGELKSDIATALDAPTISAPGATNWRSCVEVVKALGATTVVIAMDADAPRKPQIAQAVRACAEKLIADGINVEFERWDEKDGKGIDDVLVAGKRPEVLTGDAAVEAIEKLAPKVEDDAGSELASRIREKIEGEGVPAFFRSIELLRSLAGLAVTNPAEYAAQRDQLRNLNVRVSELDRVLRPLIQTARRELPKEPGGLQTETYFVSDDGCLCREKPTFDGSVVLPLCNFNAQIVEQITHDDGAERRTVLVIEGQMGDVPLPRTEVTVESFGRMDWTLTAWGTRPIVYAGMSTKDHLRVAIQSLSENVAFRTIYGHSGWRCIDDRWFYLHAGGAIGADGLAATISVSLPDALAGYLLPTPPTGADLTAAVRASLRLVDVSPARIAVPLMAATYRAAIGGTDFSEGLYGPTGAFKTELAALAQQHFGASMDARHLPANWSSTANSLEATAFAAKDAILVVDDFAPGGSVHDVQRLNREADRLLRAQGNRSARQRMRVDGSLRAAKPPRGLIIVTGEDVPRGQSLRSRNLTLEVGPGDVNVAVLTNCQKDAREGLYAAAMAAFVRWLAARFNTVCSGLRSEIERLRDEAKAVGQHARTPVIAADLALGLRYLLVFALDVGAITQAEHDHRWQIGWVAITEAADAQAAHQDAAEPTKHFLRLLAGVLASGRGHVASPEGKCPSENGESWGWRFECRGSGDNMYESCDEQGRRIGWIDGDDLYLEPEAAFAEVQRLAIDQGESLPVTQRTLQKRLREKGLLKTTEAGRGTNTVRRSIEGRRREVLHLRSNVLCAEELTNLTNPPNDGADAGDFGQFAARAGQFPGQFFPRSEAKLTSESDQFPEESRGLVSLVSSGAPTETDSRSGENSSIKAAGWEEGEF